jgi:hypothetical protein
MKQGREDPGQRKPSRGRENLKTDPVGEATLPLEGAREL